MAIDRPEAIDDAPGTGRSAAEDDGWAALLSREEWRVRQGKKAAQPALRQGDRGVSRPSARSGHQEDAWACPGTGQGRGPGQRCSPAGHRRCLRRITATTQVLFQAAYQARGVDPASHLGQRFRAVRRRSRPRRCGGACWTGPWWLPAWTGWSAACNSGATCSCAAGLKTSVGRGGAATWSSYCALALPSDDAGRRRRGVPNADAAVLDYHAGHCADPGSSAGTGGRWRRIVGILASCSGECSGAEMAAPSGGGGHLRRRARTGARGHHRAAPGWMHRSYFYQSCGKQGAGSSGTPPAPNEPRTRGSNRHRRWMIKTFSLDGPLGRAP